ncbi:hypothetical protein FXF68_32940 [Actinomadura decatromicini]|uniref:HTH luxR-type domain-containing protein n=1 Tax=Actinomadura decatromicini TaxID=2604572 RepID=A0A5D3F5M4_9ACTN|nr:hypothetical protein FXF68_32940 [Actinomadura decatromicini]
MGRRHSREDPPRLVRDLKRDLLPDIGALAVVDRTARALLDAVPADVWCGVLLDPSTLLDTGGQHESGFPQEVMPRLFEIEHGEQDDVDNLRALAGRPGPVSLLSESTRGRLDDSKYYRDILRPLGLADELRVLLRDAGRTWGLLVFCREAGSPPFGADDLAAAAALSPPASTVLRRSLLLSGIDRGDVPDAPGLIMLDGRLAVRSMTPTARLWLDRLQESRPAHGGCPYVVSAVAARAGNEGAGAVRAHAPDRSGGWVSLQAWTVEKAAESLVAVSIGPPEPRELTAIVLAAYGLTRREREITQQLLLGRSNKEIAAHFGLSLYTVQDHLGAIFEKAGVGNGRELIADLFFRHYLPELSRPAPPLSTDGRLLRPPAPDPA